MGKISVLPLFKKDIISLDHIYYSIFAKISFPEYFGKHTNSNEAEK